MNVQDLITRLQAFDPEALVLVKDSEWGIEKAASAWPQRYYTDPGQPDLVLGFHYADTDEQHEGVLIQ